MQGMLGLEHWDVCYNALGLLVVLMIREKNLAVLPTASAQWKSLEAIQKL